MSVLLRVTLDGLPPTVNHMYRTSRTGARYKTKVARAWACTATLLIAKAREGGEPYAGKAGVKIVFFTANRRRWDIDNRIKAVLDCIQAAGVIQNDNQVEILDVRREEGAKEAATWVEVTAL